MNDGGSIVEFFYNIVPGSLFILLLKYSGFDLLSGFSSDPVIVIFAYIILGLFLGFVFQSITKIARNWFGWNNRIANKVREKNPTKYEIVRRHIFNKKYENTSNRLNISANLKEQESSAPTIFYLMDSYLRGSNPAFLVIHFSSRFAFWSNMFFALVIVIYVKIVVFIALLFMCSPQWDISLLLLFLFAVISFYWSDQYFEGFYDAILKSYYMKITAQNRSTRVYENQ